MQRTEVGTACPPWWLPAFCFRQDHSCTSCVLILASLFCHPSPAPMNTSVWVTYVCSVAPSFFVGTGVKLRCLDLHIKYSYPLPPLLRLNLVSKVIYTWSPLCPVGCVLFWVGWLISWFQMPSPGWPETSLELTDESEPALGNVSQLAKRDNPT